jgi:hypothetical protein
VSPFVSLVKIVIGLTVIGVFVVLLLVSVPLVLGAIAVLLALAVLFAIYVVIRAKIRSALGLPPKPIIGVRAQAMRAYRAERAEGVPPSRAGDRENVRVRVGVRMAPQPSHDEPTQSRPDVVDVQAAPSREVKGE